MIRKKDIRKNSKKCYITAIISSFLFLLFSANLYAYEKRIVRVAFFPMDGYHSIEADGSYSGMDVEYLKEVSEYADWNIKYVECDSWEEALRKLENREVELVGSAQYSPQRAEVYDYAQLSSGHTFGVIATNADSTIAYEDFVVMQEITFGIVKDYVREEEFYQYLSDNGIEEPKVKEYVSTAKLQEALDKKEIQALVHTFTEIEEGQRLIGRFAPRPFYYITYKGNEELLGELNQAVADLKINQPQLETELMNKYYQSSLDKNVLFTTEETAYIEEQNTIVVGYVDGYYPFSYEKDGEFKGLAKDMLEKGTKEAGLQLSYKKLENNQEAQQALKENKIDILACYIGEENLGQCIVMDGYSQSPLVLVMRSENSSNSIKKLAVVKEFSQKAKKIMDSNKITIMECVTQEECAKLVSEGKADAAICDGYFIEYLLGNKFWLGNLEVKNVLNSTYTLHLAVSTEQAVIEGILAKVLTNIDSHTITEYMLQENSYPLVRAYHFIQDNSIMLIVIMLIIICSVIGVAAQMIGDSKKIQELMYKDYNLGIWNKNYLVYMGAKKLEAETYKNYSVVSLNIMQYRQYNTIYGWNAAQKMLKMVASFLKDNIDEKKEICAIDQEDRFVLLLAWEDWRDFMHRLKDIQKSLEKRVFESTENHMLIQMGVYTLSAYAEDLHIAINYAEQALEVIKNSNVSAINIYDEPMADMIRARHEKERILEAADIEHDFLVYYQSKVDIRNKEIVGAEALVRFREPMTNGIVRSPAYFVNYFEETGGIVQIDFFVLKTVCKMLRRRIDAGQSVVPISCNFSRLHFIKEGFSEQFEAILNQYGISKDLIEVEITETLMTEEYKIKEALDELYKKGIHISIDDFGAGYSSLGMIIEVPFSVIKLDRSFMMDKENKKRQQTIMTGIVRLADLLKAQTVCEGVETEEDVELMKSINAYIAQGYHYSRPIPEAEFEEKLNVRFIA